MALWAMKTKENLYISTNFLTFKFSRQLKIERDFLLNYYAPMLSEALKQVYNIVQYNFVYLVIRYIQQSYERQIVKLWTFRENSIYILDNLLDDIIETMVLRLE